MGTFAPLSPRWGLVGLGGQLLEHCTNLGLDRWDLTSTISLSALLMNLTRAGMGVKNAREDWDNG